MNVDVNIFASLMTMYEVMSGFGIILQVILLISRRRNNFLLTLALLLDAVSMSGMSFGHIVKSEPLYAFSDMAGLVIDVAFILHIMYREEHPKHLKHFAA